MAVDFALEPETGSEQGGGEQSDHKVELERDVSRHAIHLRPPNDSGEGDPRPDPRSLRANVPAEAPFVGAIEPAAIRPRGPGTHRTPHGYRTVQIGD